MGDMGVAEANQSRQVEHLVSLLRDISQDETFHPEDSTSIPSSPYPFPIRPALVRKAWEQLLPSRHQEHTGFSWARVETFLDKHGFSYISDLNLPGRRTLLTLNNTDHLPLSEKLTTIRSWLAGETPGPFYAADSLLFFNSDIDPTIVINSGSVDLGTKVNYLKTSPLVSTEMFRTFCAKFPDSTEQFSHHRQFPAEGLPCEPFGAAKFLQLSRNPYTLAEAWGRQEIVLTSRDSGSVYEQQVYNGLGLTGEDDILWATINNLRGRHSRTVRGFIAGVLTRPDAVDAGTFDGVLNLIHSHRLPIDPRDLLRPLITNRYPLSWDELEVFLLHYPDVLRADEEQMVAAWLDDDDQLDVGDPELSTLPVMLRWDILKNR